LNRGSLKRDYFEEIYSRDSDPWRFASSAYEQEKYSVTLGALARPRYACVLEVGCSIGVLTRRLADRCDRLVAIDIAASPLSEARRRCADAAWVVFAQMAVPDEWPDEKFDLIVLSEVVYYLSQIDAVRLADRIRQSLDPGGDLVLAHWTGVTDYPLTGDEASELLLCKLSGVAEEIRHERSEQFRLDIVRRAKTRP
jgi:2-polyprenyl-3-methyl-5-hydroxy-6-metoxy-1,4-benzoquinol methylase